MPRKSIDIETGVVTFSFEDESVQTFELAKAPGLVQHLALHGASQKIGDSYASAGKDENPLEFAKRACAETIAQLYDGTWRVTSEGGPKGYTVLALAFAKVSGQSVDEASAIVDAMDKDEQKALAKKPRIAATMAAIKAERAAARAAELAAKADAEEAA